MSKDKYFILDFDKQKSCYSQKTDGISPFDAGVPLFECDDSVLNQIYYFRWHTYCRHIKKTPDGYVVTEFLPDVPWAGKYNTISCPGGHHLYEGRWIHNKKYLDDYSRFWFSEGANPRLYSFWIADSIYALCMVNGDFSLAEALHENLKDNYSKWEESHLMQSGLFYQIDDRDGMEYSAGGSGNRPTINSYMYADALAISKIAHLLGKTDDEKLYKDKAETLKNLINTKLWDSEVGFYKTLAENKNYTALTDMCEQIGYIPWCFNIPPNGRDSAWKYLTDKDYFDAPYGPTTSEQKHPSFMQEFDHECLWNGPSWPFATSQTLTALSNLLSGYEQDTMDKANYANLLKTYANSHFIEENGKKRPWIDENLDPFTGEWLARKIIHSAIPDRDDKERGVDYNHSSFCDLVLSGIAGVRARDDEILEINPLFDENDFAYMCADGILYHNRYISVLWDKDESRYNKGKGLRIYIDGKEVCHSNKIEKICIDMRC